MKRKDIKVILFYVLLIGLIVFFLAQMFQNSNAAENPTYDKVVQYFTQGQVAEFNLSPDYILTMKLVDGREVIYEVANLSLFHADLGEVITQQMAAGTLKGEYEPPVTYPWWLSLLPYLIVIVLFIALWIYMARVGSKGGGKMNSFGKARVKTPNPNDQNRVLFRDVAGADEEKEELQEVVEFLKNPAKFSKLGAKIPHGVLLMGPPGTGKTLLAKAVAGEAGVPFFSISGSDFVEMYVGVGASRVRDLFETARKAPASIVFIDEIDAVGRHRGAGLGGGHDEREQTLNQLLVEMDGFGAHDGIIVIAATNRPDILDPALLRPGRFDRQITVNYPDIKGREEILKVHTRNKPLEESVDLARVARTTAGFTGADLANLLNEAALLAARRNKTLIGMDDIEEAYIKVIAGPQKKSRVRKKEELYKTAIHEAGHAIIAHVLPSLDPVQQISIIPSGNALGYTLNPPVEDKYSVYRNGLKQEIAMLLGGRTAEELMFDDISGGASNDIERATNIARQMVTRLGMSEVLGPRCFGGNQGEVFLGRDFSSSTKDYAGTTATKIDEEIHKLITEAHELARTILTEHMDKMKFIADFLMKNEVMDGEQFAAAMDGNPTIEELEEMLEAKKRKSREENDRRAKDNDKSDDAGNSDGDKPSDSSSDDQPLGSYGSNFF